MPRILIVDDELAIAEALRDLLSYEGYQVTTAADGQQALELLTASPPEVLLLDYMMPVMDGLQLLRRLRADPALQALPVVLMSAADLSALPGAELAQARLRKPFDIGRLMSALRSALGG